MTAARPSDPAEPVPPRLVLFDGYCGLCDRTVQWLLRHDSEGRLRFAPLQGDTAALVRARHPEIPTELDSLLYVEREDGVEQVLWRSRAVFRIARQLPGAVRLLSWLCILPRFLTDLGYRLVARMRHRLWGRLEACRVPGPGERARFLP